jgi:hypothetical protein
MRDVLCLYNMIPLYTSRPNGIQGILKFSMYFKFQTNILDMLLSFTIWGLKM